MECEEQYFINLNESNKTDKSEEIQIVSENYISTNGVSTSEDSDVEHNNLYQRKLIKLQNKLESKRIQKNQKVYISLPFQLKQNIGYKDTFSIFGGITVSIGKEIYLESQYQKTSIGDNFRQPLKLSFNVDKNRVDCVLQTQQKGRDQFQFLIELCNRKQSQDYNRLAGLLDSYQKKINTLKAKGNKILKVKKDDLVEIDQEYQQFVDYCFEIINKKDPNDIYRYIIGRMNYVLGDVDIQYCGNSVGYFHLIGINYNMYEQLFLRGKQLNLKSKKTEKLELSIQALEQRMDLTNMNEHKVKYRIKTVDGFELDVHEKVVKIQSPFNKHQFTAIDHLCNIVECEIDPQQISKLIEYREKLIVENNLASYEQYMSQLCEENLQDVEYTILSEQFLQKFYPEKYKHQIIKQQGFKICSTKEIK